MHARELINFWQESFKVQVETRSGALRIHDDDEDDEREITPFHWKARAYNSSEKMNPCASQSAER